MAAAVVTFTAGVRCHSDPWMNLGSRLPDILDFARFGRLA